MKLKEITSKTIEIYNYNDFCNFCNEYIDGYDLISFDVETNAKEVLSKEHRVVGFSLASNKDIGCYVVLDSIDFTMDNDNKNQIEYRLTNILLTKRILVYNCMHELSVVLNWLYIEIPKFDDLFIMVKLLMGANEIYAGTSGLKAQAQKHLVVEDWSEDLDTYIKLITTYNKDTKAYNKLKKLLLKYYNDTEIDELMQKVKHYAEEIIPKSKEFSYQYIPCKLISRYGAIDSTILFELGDFYAEWIEKESKELDIDLSQGYYLWKCHHYAGYVLERNGAYWNDDKAKVIEKWCTDGMMSTLKDMIKSPLMVDYIKSNSKDAYELYLFENYCDKLIDTNDYAIKRKYKKALGVVPTNSNAEKQLKNMSILPNKQGISKLELSNILFMGRDFIENNKDIFNQWFKKYYENVTSDDRTFDELKSIMNPNASNEVFRNYVSNLLITDRIRFAKFYDNISKMIDTPDFCLESFVNENSSDMSSCRIVSVVYKLKVADMTPTERLNSFILVLNDIKTFTNYKIRNLYKDAMIDYKFLDMSANTFNEIYELYLMCNIDVEDKRTWCNEFEWMFNHKMFKKFSKLLSTYINGTIGRKSVFEVGKNSYSNGDILTKRELEYGIRDLPDDKQYIMQTSFGVNLTDTGRWSCFTGDMKIKCLDGNDYSFEELVNNGIEELWVYSVNENGDIVPAIAFNPHITKYVDEIIEIVLDNNEVIKCTPEHLFMLNDGTYKKAKNLTENDSLMPLCYNHSILSKRIIELENSIPVYDITVNHYHNFALSCGIFVHNCGIHNLPDSDAIKGIYTSRFKGGCIAMPDGCFTGDTKIRLANGTSPEIKELVGLDKFYVYAYDESTNKNVIVKGHSCREVKKVNDLLKITFNNGKSVTCTTDHKFYSNDKMGMVEAKELNIGDSILHLDIQRKYDNFGKEREYIIHPNGSKEWTYLLADKYNVEQSLYDDVVYDLGFINRHHIDFNEDNNSPENIIRLSPQEHGRIHGTEIWKSKEYREKMLEVVKKQWSDDDFRNLMLNTSKKYGAESLRKSNYDDRCIELRRQGNRNNYNNVFFNTLWSLINKYNVPIRELLICGNKQYDNTIRDIFGSCKKGSGIRTILSQGISLYQYLVDNINDLVSDDIDVECILKDLEFINHIQVNGDRKEISMICNNYRKCDKYCKSKYMALNEENFFDIQKEILSFEKINLRNIKSVNKYFGSFKNLELYAKENHYIENIEHISVNQLPVYCFQVDTYHNYYIDCGVLSSNSQMEIRTLAYESGDESLLKAFKDGIDIHRFFASKIYNVDYDKVQKWQRGLAKNAVFGMLYGETEQTFANAYLSGDLNRAKEIYNGMFSGFPKIRDYIDRKHKQYEELGKVTTLTQRFIDLSKSREDKHRILRQSQNYPIQASAEDIVGIILYELCRWLEKNKMKSKPFCFIHDSIEIDMHPDEVFIILDKLDYLFNEFPLKRFGVPVACDVPLSTNMGAEIEMVEMVQNDNYNEIDIVLSGYEDDMVELIDTWKSVYKYVKQDNMYVPKNEDKQIYMPIAQRFLPNKAPVSMKQGTYRNMIERKYNIIVR